MTTAAVGLLFISLLHLSSEQDCSTSCNGCGTSVVSCQAADLAEFPNFSTADAALVEHLDLSVNHITGISAFDLQYFTALEELDISRNDIAYIEEGSFATNTNLSIIHLSENPLGCDCGLRWLVDYLESLPPGSQVDDWTCEHGNGSTITTPTKPQLICECAPECGSTATCDVSTGTCKCHPGYTGDNCTEMCPQGVYGLNCSGLCSCDAGSCHHITGECTCLPDNYGVNCSHDCTGAPGCAILGREACSLSTPEHSCGACQVDPGEGQLGSKWGNSSCVSTSIFRMQSHTAHRLNPTPSDPSITTNRAIAESKMSSSSLTKDQFVLVVACPLIVLLFVVDILILLSVVVYTYKRRRQNRISPLPGVEENLL